MRVIEPQWGQQFFEPGIHEEHGVDLDPKMDRLKALGITYGQRVRHRGVKLYVSGALTSIEADEEMRQLVEMRGWKLREHWWQIWRPKLTDR